MTAAAAGERRARVALSFLADPGDPVLGAALRSRTAAEVLASAMGSDSAGDAVLIAGKEDQALSAAMRRWRSRTGLVPSTARLAAWQDAGLRLIMPGDPEWPTQLDDLGDTRPLLLWARGTADLRYSCLSSVTIVGARAATNYGQTIALQLAAALAERGTGVISGGPYAIDAGARQA